MWVIVEVVYKVFVYTWSKIFVLYKYLSQSTSVVSDTRTLDSGIEFSINCEEKHYLQESIRFSLGNVYVEENINER